MTDTTEEIRDVDAAETARIIRRVLSHEFPRQKFTVRSRRHEAGGGTIRVTWTDGPSEMDVQFLVQEYQGVVLDPSIQMGFRINHWLRADGRVLVRHSPGNIRDGGSIPEFDSRMFQHLMPADTEVVQFQSHDVRAVRKVSDYQQQFADAVSHLYGSGRVVRQRGDANIHADRVDNAGNDTVFKYATSLVRNRMGGESFSKTDYRLRMIFG